LVKRGAAIARGLMQVKKACVGGSHHGAPAHAGTQQEPAMQFELSTRNPDAAVLAAALHPIDPEARIALDGARGRLEVLTDATAVQVLGVLESIGWVARPLQQEVHISGGSTCCGHCS
jgi:copper chaperone